MLSNFNLEICWFWGKQWRWLLDSKLWSCGSLRLGSLNWFYFPGVHPHPPAPDGHIWSYIKIRICTCIDIVIDNACYTVLIDMSVAIIHWAIHDIPLFTIIDTPIYSTLDSQHDLRTAMEELADSMLKSVEAKPASKPRPEMARTAANCKPCLFLWRW